MNKITLGMLSRIKTPTNLNLVCAFISKFYELDFFYFTPDDINYNDKKINGYVFNGENWERKIYDYPILIYDYLRRRGLSQYEKAYKELDNSIFNVRKKYGSMSKIDVYDKFKDSKFLIPYKKVDNFDTVDEFIENYSAVILKPDVGMRGRDVTFVTKAGTEYLVSKDEKSYSFKKSQLKDFINKLTINSTFLVQKYIHSRTIDSNPFIIRIQLMKDGKNKWVVAKIMAAFAISNVASNAKGVSRGICTWDEFCNVNFGKENFNKLDSEMKKISLNICEVFEKSYGSNISELALDMGIDKSLNIHLIEVNADTPAVYYREIDIVSNVIPYLLYLYNERMTT